MVGIKIAYYKKKDWKQFVESVDDKEKLHDTWYEWKKDFDNMERTLRSQGFEVSKVTVNIDELKKYCKSRGIKNTGKARSQFVTDK